MQDAWWPVFIGVLNLVIVLPAIALLVGWSAPVIAAVVGGLGLGCWWIYEQRPKR